MRKHNLWDEKDISFPRKHGCYESFTLDPYGAPTCEQFFQKWRAQREDRKNCEFFYLPEYNEHREKESAARHAYRLEQIASFDPTELCLHYQTPLLIIVPAGVHSDDSAAWYSQMHVMLNPQMSVFNTESLIPTFELWQEISMFIGGVIPGGQSPMVEISNDSKIQKAGFDTKTSFRRTPEV